MAGNDLHVGGQRRHGFLDVLHHAEHATAAGDVHEGQAVGDEIVAHVDHVRLREVDDAVAVGVPLRVVQRPDVLAVDVNGQAMVEGDHRQGSGGGRVDLAGGIGAPLGQAHANVVVSDEGRRLTHLRVAAGVVAVPMRVQYEA